MGLLVAKTLTNATANPFLSGGTGAYNPVLALDVFLVQVRGGKSARVGGTVRTDVPTDIHTMSDVLS